MSTVLPMDAMPTTTTPLERFRLSAATVQVRAASTTDLHPSLARFKASAAAVQARTGR